MNIKKDISPVTVPLKQPTKMTRIELRVKTEHLDTYRENDTFSRVAVDIPFRDIGIDRISQNLRDELEMKGISRDIAGKACDAMVELLYKELVVEALREMICEEHDTRI